PPAYPGQCRRQTSEGSQPLTRRANSSLRSPELEPGQLPAHVCPVHGFAPCEDCRSFGIPPPAPRGCEPPLRSPCQKLRHSRVCPAHVERSRIPGLRLRLIRPRAWPPGCRACPQERRPRYQLSELLVP